MSSYPFTSAEFARCTTGPSPASPAPTEAVPFAGLDFQKDWALLGESMPVRRLRSQILRVAPYFRTALIRGEQGSGKEVVARAIHAHSAVADGPFIVADACALANSLDREPSPAHSSLNPTSGSTAREIFEFARGGTVYITRVGELSLGPQAALFRFLKAFDEDRNAAFSDGPGRMQPHRVRGADGSSIAQTGILASSTRDLRTLAGIGQFRKDLYSRLSVLEIFVPPLRERADDIPILGEYLLCQLAKQQGQSPKSFAASALLRLQQHSWSGNFPELKRVITQAAALTQAGVIEAHNISGTAEPQAAESTAVGSDRLHEVVQRHVLDVLLRCAGNKVRAAELLGISRSTLYRMLGVKPGSGGLVD